MHTNEEKLAVLQKSKLTIRDIQVLMDCGSKKAAEKSEEFRRWFEREYKGYSWNGIPTHLFTKLNLIPEGRIEKYAEMERKRRLLEQSPK